MTNTEPDSLGVNLSELPLFRVPSSGISAPTAVANHLAAAISKDAGGAEEPEPNQATPTQQPSAAPPVPPRFATTEVNSGSEAGTIDWAVVADLRTTVSEKYSEVMTEELDLGSDLSVWDRQQGWTIIQQVIRDHIDTMVRQGQIPWDQAHEARMSKALYDAIFGLGRMQALVDDPKVKNAEIYGDKVYVDYGGGDVRERPAVADSDEQLIADLQFIAGRGGERGRSFSSNSPLLSMTLPGGERLEAVHPPISPRPLVVIRRHPLITTTLNDLIDWGTITEPAVKFLSAAVLAGRNIVISGHQGAGKTTLLRALAHVLDPMQAIVTIESERELHLDKSGLHHRVRPLESRPGQGEQNASGRRPGQISLADLLHSSFRLNTLRVFLGECRGPEIEILIQAMQAGAGTMSTIHTRTAKEAIDRLATLIIGAMGTTDLFAYRQVAHHFDFVVQVTNQMNGKEGGVHFISEIAQVVPGESGIPSILPIFKADRGSTVAEPVASPTEDLLDELEDAGESIGFTRDLLRPNYEGMGR